MFTGMCKLETCSKGSMVLDGSLQPKQVLVPASLTNQNCSKFKVADRHLH